MRDAKKLEPKECELLFMSITENLQHARHGETLRFHFLSIYMVIVAGVMALAIKEDVSSLVIDILIAVLLGVMGMIGIAITLRSRRVSNEHIEAVEKCLRDLGYKKEQYEGYYPFHVPKKCFLVNGGIVFSYVMIIVFIILVLIIKWGICY